MHMYKIKRITSKAIVIFCIITMLFSGRAYATEVIRDEETGEAKVVVTVEEAGNATSDFARNFNSYYGSQTEHLNSINDSYSGEKIDDKYKFSSVGWIEFVIYNSLGLDVRNEGLSCFRFGSSSSTISCDNKYHFIKKSSTALDREQDVRLLVQPGDILFEEGGQNIAIYTGGEIIYCANGGLNQISLYPEDGKTRTDFNDYCAIARIKETSAHELVASEVTTLFNQNDDDTQYNTYYGTTEGRYVGSYSFNLLDWLFKGFIGFFDYLFGIIFYIIKAPFLGWANIVENWINDNINYISGITVTDVPDTDMSQPGYTPDARDIRLSKRINVEDIIYNKVPLLDVDIFDVGLSKYQNEYITIDDQSILYLLKDNIAAWYYGIRNVSIVGMLLVLIYLGIRLAISSTGQGKSKYKQMLVAWVTSFVAIFFIHYFMIIVIEANQVLIDWFSVENTVFTDWLGQGIKNGLPLYDTIRTRAYSLKLSEALPATIMYIVLVYYLIKFLFVYIRRYFTINILALMAPIMCAKNAFDKISKGKSGSMSAWMYDFALNVWLQALHAIVYTIYMLMAYKFAMESIAGFALALIFMNFIFKAESLFIKIFRFDDAKSLKDVKEGKNYITDGFKAGVGLTFYTIGVTKFGFGLVKNTTKAVVNTAEGVVQIGADVLNKIPGVNTDIDVVDSLEKSRKARLQELNDSIQRLTGYRSLSLDLENLKDSDPTLYTQAKKKLDENKKLKKQIYSRSLKNGINPVKNMFALLTGTASVVVDPKVGVTAFATTLFNLGDSSNRKMRYGHKRNIIGRAGSITANVLTLGAYSTLKSNIESNNKELDKLRKSTKQIQDMRKADALEIEIENQTKEIKANIKPEDIDTFEEIRRQMIKNTLESVLYGKNIKSAVKNYMYKNNLTKITSHDIEGIMREFNLAGIEKDIKSLTKTSEINIEKLEDEVDDLKDVINNAIQDVNEDASDEAAKKKLKDSKKELNGKEEKLKNTKKELDVIKHIERRIQYDSSLREGMHLDIKQVIKEYKLDKQSKDGKDYYLVDSDVKEIIEKYKKEQYVSIDTVKAKFEAEEAKKAKKSKPTDQPIKKERERVANIFLDSVHQDGEEKLEKIKEDTIKSYSRNSKGKINKKKEQKAKDIITSNPDIENLVSKMRELKTLNEKYENKYGQKIVYFNKYTEKPRRR